MVQIQEKEYIRNFQGYWHSEPKLPKYQHSFCQFCGYKAVYSVLQDESVGTVDYKKYRAPGQHRTLWDVSSLEVIIEADGADAWEEA